MKVTYLSHSGFAVELPSATLLFDYYKGQMPDFPTDKPLFVFSSHSHGDHFVPQVFDLAKQYPHVRFVFSHDIWMMRKKHTRAGVSEEAFTSALYMRAHETQHLPLAVDISSHTVSLTNVSTPVPENHLTVTTLRSTDMGVAFLIECDHMRIYHAGDLHWWAWPGDTKQAANNMTANYQREISYLRSLLSDSCLDLAFLPLDGRLEENYALGMDYFLQQITVHHVFPMHFWDRYEVITDYLNPNRTSDTYRIPSKKSIHSAIYHITEQGQRWSLK